MVRFAWCVHRASLLFSSFLRRRRRLSRSSCDTDICTVAKALCDSETTALAFPRHFATVPTAPVAVMRRS